MKQMLMDIDREESDRIKAKNINPDKLEQKQGELSAMRFLKERETSSKF